MGRFQRAIRLLGLVPVLVTAVASAVHAASGPWQRAEMVEARLVAAVDGTGRLETVPLGLEVRLAPGWKTYWRSPGDAGLPPRIDWSGSDNLAAADMKWPAPHRFTLFGFETFGYDTEVVFPIEARLAEAGRPLDLRAGVDLLVCSDICVPQRFDLALHLPAGPADPGPEANLIARHAARVPGDGAAAGLGVTRVVAAGAPEAPVLVVEATARESFVAPDVFVETDPAAGAFVFGAPEVQFRDDDRRVLLHLPVLEVPEGSRLAGTALTLTLVDGARSLETRATVAAGPPTLPDALAAPGGTPGAGASAPAGGLLAMLGVALLGGLILNLMPCVLPVLSLKLLSVVSHGGAAPRTVRLGFLAAAAGILFSFLVLAAGAVALKAAGAAVGWGIQFQQPLFLVFMVVLLTLFACNLWGVFEVPLPGALANALGRPGGDRGLAGHLATGAFATLLATPCSAPFLGTAVGFALARGPAEILAVFAALGTGLALPYLLVAAVPRLAARLPRPGRWMVTLRRLLGVALALTALWLLSVLAAQAGQPVALAVGALMVALALALWARAAAPVPALVRRAGAALAGLFVLAAFAAPASLGDAGGAAGTAAAVESRWVRFDESAIAAHVAAGRVVFVDVAADWCITCQANKTLVLERGRVAERLFGTGAPGGRVVAMQADWTRPDERIARYLARFGRYGIPFNVVYGPAAPDGIPLPELLTEGAVLEALDRAAAAS